MIGVLNINGIDLDIDQSVIVPLNYAIADARNPQKRKRNTSKVIGLKGTKRNRDFFFSAWNLGASDERGDGIGFNYDPTIKYPAYYTERGEVIFNGAASLESIDINKENYTFNVVLYSNVVDVFQALGDLTLPELDWSAYNHALSVANIQASWSAAIGSGYIYPVVDYGFTDDLLSYQTNEIFPHVYWKEVFEKAFALSDLTIDSDFFDSTLFKSLVIGSGGGEKQLLTPAQQAERRSDHTADGIISEVVTAPQIIPITPATPFGAPTTYRATYTFNETVRVEDNAVITTALVNDPNAQYDATTGRVTLTNTGFYNLNTQLVAPFTFGFVGGTITSEELFLTLSFKIRRNGAIIREIRQPIDQTFTSPYNLSFNIDQSLYLEANDVIEFEFEIVLSQAVANIATLADLPTSYDYALDLNNTFEFNLTSTQAEIVDGDTVEVASYLPALKVSDFLNGVIKAFNLYVGEPNERGEVKIEPLTTFYESTADAKVMSQQVDYSKPIKIQPAAGVEGKRYLFQFAEDRDHYKQLYFDEYGVDYGDYIYDVPSTFKKGDKVYKLPFAQSVPVEIAGTEIIIPRIVSYDPINEITSPYKGKARVYYYQGLKTLSTDSWDLVNSATQAATNLTNFPEFGHLDDRTSPTFDLNFGRPEIVFYTATAYTTNNLFVGYHDQFIRELTGRDAKFLQLYMKLGPQDLQGEFLRQLWNIKGTIYRINKIEEYNGNGENTTWCELVRINKGKSPKQIPLTPLTNPKKSITAVNQFEKSIRDFGYGNSIPETSKSILIQGDNNTIDPGVDNVTILNSSGFTVSDSGTTIIGGIPISGDGVVQNIAADTTALEEVAWYRVSTSGGDVTVTLPSKPTTNKRWNFKKLTPQNKLIIVVSGGGAAIDGKTELVVKQLNSAPLIAFNGLTYNIL